MKGAEHRSPTNSRADRFASVIVYPLWHVGHHNEAGDDGSTVHVDDSGVFCDEADGDDVKLLGIYSTLERVEERVRQARLLPGFHDEPECFHFGQRLGGVPFQDVATQAPRLRRSRVCGYGKSQEGAAHDPRPPHTRPPAQPLLVL